MKISIAAVALLLSTPKSLGLQIGSSLSECKAIASRFRNTCTQAPDGPADWTNSFQGTSVTCTQSRCPSGVSGSPCTWSRKLCVSCSQVDSDVYLHIQTNGLPDHCFASPQAVNAQKIDFKVKFNPTGAPQRTFDTQSAFDNAVCTPMKTQLVPSQSGFVQTPGTQFLFDTVMGIAINGVTILSSASAENIDPFYPRRWSGVKRFQSELTDGCLAHPQIQGIYHYHILSPCLINPAATEATKPCAAITECMTDLRSYALSFYENSKQETLLGVGKDGHMILGPYKDDGSVFDCNGFDQCSGTTSSDGSYVYIFNEKYPYINDCFGPAQAKVFQASCSTNTCIPQSKAQTSQLTIILLLAALAFANLF